MSVALYRKYRPSAFDDVQGQGEKVASIARAVAAGTPHHAYLFTGPHGVGKTTTARLIAAGLNCAQGPTASPCGECASCRDIAGGSAMDVQEIDAASSNSVDNIRELRVATRTVPAFGDYRVYILDEVHMLSTSAWNALLKTLEEPPPHCIFVLCTTETSKVPATVISRCQHVRFSAPNAVQIAERVGVIAQREGLEVDAPAAVLLGRAARGSYRDGLQLLQQALGRVEDGAPISEAVVRSMLGSEDESQILAAMKAVAGGDLAGALAAAAMLASDREPEVALRDLEALARDVLICAAVGRIPPTLQTTPARDDLLARTFKALGKTGAARLLDEIGAAMLAIRAGADARTRLELALAKAADPALTPPVPEQLARRLDRVEGAVMGQQRSRRPT